MFCNPLGICQCVADGYIGVTQNLTGTYSGQTTLTGTKDITHCGTTEHYVAGIFTILGLNLVAANLTVTSDVHIGIALHGSHLTATIYAGPYYAFEHIHIRCTSDIAATVGLVTHTAAIYTTEGVFHSSVNNLGTDGAAQDVNFCVTTHRGCSATCNVRENGTKLTTTIDVTLDGTTADGQLRSLYSTKLHPVNAVNSLTNSGAIQLGTTSHTAGKDITAQSMTQAVVALQLSVRHILRGSCQGCASCFRSYKVIFISVTNSTAADVDVGVTALEAARSSIAVFIIHIHGIAFIVLVIGTHNTIVGIAYRIQSVAHRAQTSTAIDTT